MKGLRHIAVHLALAALFLRAMLPAGWMPNPQAAPGAPFIICSIDSAAQDGKAQKQTRTDPRAHEACPFAAAAPLAAAPNGPALAAPRLSSLAAPLFSASATTVFAAPYAPQSPRAPPVSA